MMNRIEKILEELNLIYYEYDNKLNMIVIDKFYSKSDAQFEFLKLTYTLTKNNIKFLVDEKNDIIVFSKDNLFIRIKQRLKNILNDIRSRNKNIFVLSEKITTYGNNIPVISIEYIKQDVDLSKYDGLIFTSQNAIKAIEFSNLNWKEKPSYVIAPQTAKILRKYGGNLKFVGRKKYGDEFAYELIEELKGKKVLYISGEKIVSNLVQILNDNDVICENIAFYRTVCKKYRDNTIIFPKNSIFIFSSPSTIECFFKNFKWQDDFKAISIGKTTSKFFPKDITPYMAETTSLESCIKKAMELKKGLS